MTTLLFTGASGFLGTNTLPLLKQNYDVDTMALDIRATYNVNLVSDDINLNRHYDVVLHAAGKAHVVPRTDAENKLFYDINYGGTKKVCKALEKVGVPKAFIFISTVAVYGCEKGELITEDYPLNGTSAYAKSKIMAEQYLTEWCLRNNVTLGILRPSLLAGRNAPGNLGAMVNGIRNGFYLNIAGGQVKKSILMADDIAYLLPKLADKGGVYNVCDTNQPSFGQIAESIANQLNKHKPISIPYWMAWCIAKFGDLLGNRAPINSYKLSKMTESLTFSNEKARKTLEWEPLDVLTNYKI